jgi:hypothetical protein
MGLVNKKLLDACEADTLSFGLAARQPGATAEGQCIRLPELPYECVVRDVVCDDIPVLLREEQLYTCTTATTNLQTSLSGKAIGGCGPVALARVQPGTGTAARNARPQK